MANSAKLNWPLALALAAGSGFSLAAIFPTYGLDWLAWVALVPLFLVIARAASLAQTFWAGYLAGALFFALSCPWIATTIRQYGDLSPAIAGFVFILFIALMGVYLGVFALAAGWLGRRCRHRLLPLPFVWIAVELFRTYTPMGGFPWNLLGYSQYQHPGFMLTATVAGVYGAGFLIAVVNTLVTALALLFFDLGERGFRPRLATAEAIGLGLLLAFATLPYHPAAVPPPALSARLVQPDTPMNQAWSNAQLDQFLAQQISLSSGSAAVPYPPSPADVSLILWPEQSAPLDYSAEPALQQATADIQQRTHSAFLFAEVAFEGRQPHNSALLVNADGTTGDRYDKTHLVPFGEYDPLPPWLQSTAGIGKIVANVSDFVPGNRQVLFPLNGHRFAAFICYESIFPSLVRRDVAAGAEWLVNLSDDGWYGDSSAAPQGLAMAQVRAIENRRWLLRDTNDGITAVIDPYGRITARLPRNQAASLVAGFSPITTTTFYTRHGDWLPYSCLGLLALLTLLSRKPIPDNR